MHPKTILAAVAASGSAVAFAQEVEVLISRPSKSNDHAGSFVGYGVVRRNTCMNPEDNMGKVVKGSQFHIFNKSLACVLYGTYDCTVGNGTRLLAAPGTPDWDEAFNITSFRCGLASNYFLSAGQQEKLKELNSKAGH